jgi:hypothetical protein
MHHARKTQRKSWGTVQRILNFGTSQRSAASSGRFTSRKVALDWKLGGRRKEMSLPCRESKSGHLNPAPNIMVRTPASYAGRTYPTPKNGYPDQDFSWFSSVPIVKLWDITLKYSFLILSNPLSSCHSTLCSLTWPNLPTASLYELQSIKQTIRPATNYYTDGKAANISKNSVISMTNFNIAVWSIVNRGYWHRWQWFVVSYDTSSPEEITQRVRL